LAEKLADAAALILDCHRLSGYLGKEFLH